MTATHNGLDSKFWRIPDSGCIIYVHPITYGDKTYIATVPATPKEKQRYIFWEEIENTMLLVPTIKELEQLLPHATSAKKFPKRGMDEKLKEAIAKRKPQASIVICSHPEEERVHAGLGTFRSEYCGVCGNRF